jgi:three-Cys-motif partner protein
MAVPKETIWKLDDHSAAKHKILETYLKAWFPIICRWNNRVNYVDGFAGPGKYTGGEDGSPIIAMSVAINHTTKLKNQINFIFIEKDDDRAEFLKKEIVTRTIPLNFNWQVVKGEFHSETMELLDYLEKDNNTLAPTFAFIDPFGFSGIPFNIIERLLAIPKVEVFLTFMVDSINRFIEDDKTGQHIKELFGSDDVEKIIEFSKEREKDLRAFYQKKLEENANFVRYFKMCDNNDRTIYYLFFATNNELGNVRMKEAMWKVDDEGLYRFSDATDVNQIVLFQNDYKENIFTILKSEFDTDEIDVIDLKKFIENNTPYLEKHLKDSLRYAEENNIIEIDELKEDGSKRRKNSFPDGVIVKFK